jgi:hypothetical protein
MKQMLSIGAAMLACAALSAPLTAAAQPAPSPAPAERNHKDDLEKLTRAISQQHDGQLARFEDAVCIAVSGFDDPYNALFAARMAEDARQAGLAVAGAGCHPNIVVVMTGQPRQELASLAQRSGFLASIGARESDVRLLSQSAGPAYVLTFTELRSTGGAHEQAGSLRQDNAPQLLIHESSIINPPTRQDIAAVLMVIDTQAMLGRKLEQIADYAALRSLADLREAPAAGAEPTILTLFSGQDSPQGLTPYDQAYLKGLYHGPSALKAETRMHEIVNTALHGQDRE